MKGREKNSQKSPSNISSEKFTTSNDLLWTPERIRSEVEDRGHTLASLARKAGFHESAVRVAIRRPWPKVEKYIAEFLDIKEGPSGLFPERYDSAGYPLKYSKHLGNTNAKKKEKKK